MKPIQFFIESPFASDIGWTILHSLWEGAIISGVLAVTLTMLRTSRARYIAASIAMLAMVFAFFVTLGWMLPKAGHNTPALNAITTLPSSIQSANSAFNPWRAELAALVPWLAPFWFAGVLLMYMQRLASCVMIQRLCRRGVCSAPIEWQNRLARISDQLRISRPVVLLESCLAEVPMVLGHFRPLILMPVGLITGLTPIQIEVILLHELAHIRRHDYLVNLMQRFAEGLLFYHPAVWWISSLMRSEREHCCDDIAVSISGNAREYAITLTTLEQNRLCSREPAVAVTGGNLVKRIHRLLYPKASGTLAPFLAVTILVMTAAVSIAAWQSGTHRVDVSTSTMRTNSSMGPEYAKWLQEDAAYIITNDERAKFQQLPTDKDREKFIEQFWLRRDPPGAPANTFKHEHYRRLAFANIHFAAGDPGWQTDRGHIYIVYGPPDSIDSRTGENGHAVQVWRYRHIEGVGSNGMVTFIDIAGDGDFRLAPGGERN
jgi:GWxTD domain-containing protein